MTSDGNEAKLSWPRPNGAHQTPTAATPEQWDRRQKLSTPSVDEFCMRTERSLCLAMAFIRREIYWVVRAVAFPLPPSPNTAQALASWASRLRKNKAREASRGSQNQQATSLLILMGLGSLSSGSH